MSGKQPRKPAPERANLLDLADVAGSGFGDEGRRDAATARLGRSINAGYSDDDAAGVGPAHVGLTDEHALARLTSMREELPTLELTESTFYKTLTNAVRPAPLPPGVKMLVEGDVAHHPFRPAPASTGGSAAMTMFKLTGLGYAYYRVANTRLRPGEITYLQDGSEQYVIARPGLYYFPGPTRTLYEPQRVEGELVSLGNVKIVTVPPGRVGFCRFKNQIHVLDPGAQYVLDSPYIEYVCSEPLSVDRIEVDSVLLISVQAGQLAVVRDAQGHVVVIKDVGRFLLRQPEQFIGLYSMTEERIDVGGYQRVRLLAGRLIFYRDALGETRFEDQPGVYELRNPAAFIGGFYDVNKKEIREGSLHIIRLQAGEIALVQAEHGAVDVLVEPKRYVLHAPSRFLGFFSALDERIEVEGYQRVRLVAGKMIFYRDASGEMYYKDEPGIYELRPPSAFVGSFHFVNQREIVEGSLHIFRLQAGELACVSTVNGDVDTLEEPKRYVLRAPERLLGIYSVNEPRIEHGTYERVRLQAGSLVFWQDDLGRTRQYDTPGTYSLKRPAFFDRDIHDVNVSVLKFGSVVRLNLKHGEISFKYRADGATELLSLPGVHIIDRPEQYGGGIFRKSERTIALGAYTLVNVPPGHIAITYDGRESSKKESALHVLPEGHHVLDHELWRLQEIRSIQEKRLDLKCSVYSRNRVSFAVGAFVLFRVVDPKRAFVDVENIEDELRREAEATLLSIFNAHDSEEISRGVQDPTAHMPAHGLDVAVGRATASGPAVASSSSAPASGGDVDLPSYEQSFADVVRSAFQQNIRSFAEERGVSLTRMRVEHMDFVEEKMKLAIEQQAEMSIQIAAQRKNIEQRNQTLRLEAEGKAAALNVEASAAANAKNLETQAEVTRIKETAEAQNVASKTPLAMQLALIDAYAKGQAGIFSALSDKISVVPSDISLSMGSLPAQIQNLLAGASSATSGFSVPRQ